MQAIADAVASIANDNAWTEAIKTEHEILCRMCPRLCDGSQRNVGSYLKDFSQRSGVSLEHVSYSWRLHPVSFLDFLAGVGHATRR